MAQVSWTQGSQWNEVAPVGKAWQRSICQATVIPSPSSKTASLHFPMWPIRKRFLLPSFYLPPSLLLSPEISSQCLSSRSFGPHSHPYCLKSSTTVICGTTKGRGSGQLWLPLCAVPSGSTVQCLVKGSGCQLHPNPNRLESGYTCLQHSQRL